jgi:catechol 2,3-dioxygenase-like lactoylglutathione lyase family enzyme
MADWEKRIGAMTLFVPDLDRARQFYQGVFGLDAQPADDDTIVLPRRPAGQARHPRRRWRGGENHGPFGRKALEFCFLPGELRSIA